jgi:hypothetical protein
VLVTEPSLRHPRRVAARRPLEEAGYGRVKGRSVHQARMVLGWRRWGDGGATGRSPLLPAVTRRGAGVEHDARGDRGV